MKNQNDNRGIELPWGERKSINEDDERRSDYSRDNRTIQGARPIITTSQETGEDKPED